MPRFTVSIDDGAPQIFEEDLPYNLSVTAGQTVSVSALEDVGAISIGQITAISAMIYGQSEPEYLLNPGSVYRGIPQPVVPATPNLVVFTQSGDNVAPVRTQVNSTTVAAGQVNPTMAAFSALFAYVRPGQQFVIGDGCVPGTPRTALHNNTDARRWTDFTSVVNAIEAEFGPVNALVECWYNSDAAYIGNFGNAFWPSYFGQTFAGDTFTLGQTHTVTDAVVQYILWDADAAPNAKGRGIFTRADTKWNINTPMPFSGAPNDVEAQRFTQGIRIEEPDRAVMHGLASNALAQSVDIQVGPSAHLCDFGGGIHPVTDDRDGQILLGWPLALSILRRAGVAIEEPQIIGIEGPTDGTHADLVVSLPNGGTLTTLRSFRGQTLPTTSPHQQAVTGVEINRFGASGRRPVFRTTETSYPADNRGTVTIIDSGSGNPRVGRVRITPEVAFRANDSLSYLRGQASAQLLKPRDVTAKLYRDMLIEHVPGLYDASATYPLEGIAVRPYQAEYATLVPAAASLIDFSTGEGRSPSAGTSLVRTPADDGWDWNVGGGVSGARAFWSTNGVTATTGAVWTFDILATDFTGQFIYRVSNASNLSGVRGASGSLALVNGVSQSASITVTPSAEAAFMGFVWNNSTVSGSVRITNLRLAVG